MNRKQLVSIALLLSTVGCDTREGAPPESPPVTDSSVTAPTPEPPSPPPATTQESVPAAATDARAIERATVGVGRKGRGYGGDMITEPLRTRFRAEERLRLATVDYALKLYKAEHDKLPESHAEFMEKIVRANQIPLPPLPAGDQYWYDAETGQLMVRHEQ